MAPSLLKTLIAALAICTATAVHAVTIPAGQAEGVYTVSVAADGTETHIKIGDLNTTAPADFALLRRAAAAAAASDGEANGAAAEQLVEKRFNWPAGTYVSCNNAYFWGDDFYSHAWNSFFNGCFNTGGAYMSGTRILYAYYGTSVAYECNYGSGGNPCYTDEWVDAVNWAQGVCTSGTDGWRQAAYLNIPAWAKSYGYDNAANSFC